MTDEEITQALANGKTVECYVYKSGDAVTWTKSAKPFSPDKQAQEFKDENERLQKYINATRAAHPRGIYKSYAFRIECFEEGQAPESFVDNQQGNPRIGL